VTRQTLGWSLQAAIASQVMDRSTGCHVGESVRHKKSRTSTASGDPAECFTSKIPDRQGRAGFLQSQATWGEPRIKLPTESDHAETAIEASRGSGRGRGGRRGSHRTSRSRSRRSSSGHSAFASRTASRSTASGSAASRSTSRGACRSTGSRSTTRRSSVAAAATAVTTMTVMTTTRAATAISRSSVTATITTRTTVAAVTGHSRVAFTAQKGDADHREERRDAKNQCTIHSKILHKDRYRTVRESTTSVRFKSHSPVVTAAI
jgi:hypothetical protein